MKEKTDNLNYIKIKNFCSLEDVFESLKASHKMGEDTCNRYINNDFFFGHIY